MLDSAHFDLVRINQLRGRADQAIAEDEVQVFFPLSEGSIGTATARR
jgi:hypothetical protein